MALKQALCAIILWDTVKNIILSEIAYVVMVEKGANSNHAHTIKGDDDS
jgi:hypothetical protein